MRAQLLACPVHIEGISLHLFVNYENWMVFKAMDTTQYIKAKHDTACHLELEIFTSYRYVD
jgi:hypothetical protein